MKRRLGVLAVVLSIAAAFSVARALTHRRRSSPLSCVLTASSGSLTVVTSEAMLGLEWSEGVGRVGVGTAQGTPVWSPRPEAEVRALAARMVEPVLEPARSATADRVSLFAICDDAGVPWEGMSFRPPGNYFECVNPPREPRLRCVERVYERRKAEVDETAGAVSDRVTAEVIAGGIVIPPSTFDAEPPFIDFQF